MIIPKQEVEPGVTECVTVKSPVITFDTDYSLWNTEAHRNGIILRRNLEACKEYAIFKNLIHHHQEFIIPNDREPYQGAITRAALYNAERVSLYGISDFHNSHRSLIAEIYTGDTRINSAVYDRYVLDCEAVSNGVGQITLYSDLRVAYSNMGHVLTRDYSSIMLKNIDRIGSVFPLTFEPDRTKVRFAVTFDDHKSYHIFNRRTLIHLDDSSPENILANGNDRNDLCYGMRNFKPLSEKLDFKIVMSSDVPSATPVFYGFRVSMYGNKPNVITSF